jgi:hypothetical protein
MHGAHFNGNGEGKESNWRTDVVTSSLHSAPQLTPPFIVYRPRFFAYLFYQLSLRKLAAREVPLL